VTGGDGIDSDRVELGLLTAVVLSAPSALINALVSSVLSEPLSGRGPCDSAAEDATKPVH
jgi:hypothetical protein